MFRIKIVRLITKATRLIHTIQKFLIRFKEEKKKALAKKLEAKLQSYLHKTNLVKKVIVDINGNGDDVDICLFGYDDKKIDNSILSMGERQIVCICTFKCFG